MPHGVCTENAQRANRRHRRFSPHDCTAPQATPEDLATKAADMLAEALRGTSSHAPYQCHGNDQLKEIDALSNIFKQLTRTTSHGNQQPRVVRATPEIQPRVNIDTPKQTRVPIDITKTPLIPNTIPYDDDEVDDNEVVQPRYNLLSAARYAATV